ncbi:MAG: hypothetical protein ACTSVC_12870 [Promethearchaeota archaeon]
MENITIYQYIILKLLEIKKKIPIKGKIHFQKSLFLILRNFPPLFEEAHFIKDKFGPYSEALENTLQELIRMGKVEIDKGNIVLKKDKDILRILESKEKIIENKNALKEFEEMISNIKNWQNGINTDEFLAFIYKYSPEYIENSIKADELNYEELLYNLYLKEKISISKFAELLGWSIEEAYEFIKKKSEEEK